MITRTDHEKASASPEPDTSPATHADSQQVPADSLSLDFAPTTGSPGELDGRSSLRAWVRSRADHVKVAGVLAVLFFGISLAFTSSAGPDLRYALQHLGAEYYHVGRAIADGRGYSDPFSEPTGPTAWMPPLYPLLLGALLAVLKTRSLTASAIILLMNVTLVAIGTTIHAIAKRYACRLPPWLCVAFFVGWTLVFSYWFFRLTSDIWLLALLVDVMVLLTFNRIASAKPGSPWTWGILGGLAALANPALTIAWAAMSLLLFLRARRHWRTWVLSAAIAAVVASPWPIRNAWVFHRFIPVKSNVAFEACQANIVDDDGIYDDVTMGKHPYNQLDMRFRYAQLGEMSYLREYEARFQHYLQTNKADLIRRILHRASCATMVYMPLAATLETPETLRLKRAVYPIPFIVLLASFWIRGPHRRFLASAVLFYVTYLLPYVLVAFYVRYILPLTPLLMVVLFLGLDQLASRLLDRRGELRSAKGYHAHADVA